MDAFAIIWPVFVVLIWGAVFGLTLLLVRMTTRDQQTTARAEVAAENAAARAATEPERAAPVAAAPRRAPPPLPAT
ncbi:MAG TPA: hypothetical protein VFN78_13975 [Ktedonobacterales bacterium]|nr:hypothetical protein [Ktedonobacterales bacterium]